MKHHVRRSLLMNMADDDAWDQFILSYDEETQKKQALSDKKCTCGASITMGKDDHHTFHSDYCPLSDSIVFGYVVGYKETKQ